ncbi:MAG TPA: hypothetical protein HPP76_08915 [Desulfuromonadales bacterium]|nr:hypothetical protein [Desulfuromonadales bacterium]
MVTSTKKAVAPTEAGRIKRKLREYQARIIALQFEIGRESASHSDLDGAAASLELRANIARVKDCEREIEILNQRLAEIAEAKAAAAAALKEKATKVFKKRKKTAPAAEPVPDIDRSAIAEAMTVIPLEAEAIVESEENAHQDDVPESVESAPAAARAEGA